MVSPFFPPPTQPHHPALLRKSYLPGRIRGTAEDILTKVFAQPQHGASILAKELRHARHLHSRERKFVAEGVYALIRYHSFLAQVSNTKDFAVWWNAWLQWQGFDGLDIDGPDLNAAALSLIETSPTHVAFHALSGFCSAISDALVTSLGDDCWAFLHASNQKGPLVLRVNPQKASRQTVQDALAEQNIETQTIPDLPLALKVVGTANVHGQRSYQKGWFEIQDAGSQRLAQLAGPLQETVIDYCAGAGGKTLALAASGPPNTAFTACDVRTSALKELEKRARRAGIAHRVRTHTLPTTHLNAADTVFVDAPCTGLGTLRRTPTLRLRLDADELVRIEHLQKQILGEAKALVNPGGRLVYGTCSVLHHENEAITQWFLTHAPDFRIAQGTRPLKQNPHEHDTDGFYGVVFERRD